MRVRQLRGDVCADAKCTDGQHRGSSNARAYICAIDHGAAVDMHRYRSAGISSVKVLFFYNQQVAEMSLVYGLSSKGERTLLCRGFEYIKECDNICGTVSWRCRFNKSLKWKRDYFGTVLRK
jgi:hypothetical protein